jgi:hypothetical protein
MRRSSPPLGAIEADVTGESASLGGRHTDRTGSLRACSSCGVSACESLHANGWELPANHDPRYKCEMHVLRFDSGLPNPRYAAWIEQFRTAPVICRAARRLCRQNGSRLEAARPGGRHGR